MPDTRHVVVGVEVAPPVGCGHPHAAGADDVDRLVVGERLDRRTERRLPPSRQPGVRNVPDVRPEPPRHLVPADREQRLDRLRDGAVVALRERGVLEAPFRAPRRDRDRHRGPRGEQLAQEPQLDRLERGDALVPVEDQPRGAEKLVAVPVVEQRIEQRREVGDERAVAHVAEIDDPADQPGVVGEGVVGRQVAVDDLGPERRPDRDDRRFEPVQDLFDETPVAFVADRAEQLA